MAGMTLIVRTVSRLLFPFIFLFGIYVAGCGYLCLGGGFVLLTVFYAMTIRPGFSSTAPQHPQKANPSVKINKYESEFAVVVGSPLINKTIEETEKEFGVRIEEAVRVDGVNILDLKNPIPLLEPDTILKVVGTYEQIKKLRLFSIDFKTRKLSRNEKEILARDSRLTQNEKALMTREFQRGIFDGKG